MSLIPLWTKALIVAALLAACAWGIHRFDVSRQEIGYQRAVSEYNVKLIAAQDDARAQEAAWQAKQKTEQEATNEKLNERDAQYAVLSRAADGLRNAATNYGNGLPDDSVAACRQRASTLADVFGQCSEALRDVARAADGQYIDAVSCRESWPE